MELVVGYEHGGLYFYDGVVAAVAVVVMADETNEEMCTEADEAIERGGGGYVERNEKREKVQRRYSTGSGNVEVQRALMKTL